MAAQHTAVSQAWHPAVWQLAWALDIFQIRRGHRHNRLAVWRAALDAVTHLPDSTPRIYSHQRLGLAYAHLDRHDEGISHLHDALALAEEHGNIDQQAHIQRMLALVWERQQDERQALEHANRSLDLFRALDQPEWEAGALNSVGWHAARLGDYDTARVHCEAALSLLGRHPFPEGEAATLDSLGYIAHHTGHYQQAIDYYRRAVAVFHALGSTSEAANALDTLGHSHLAFGEHENASAVWREALELYRQQARDEDAARVQRQLDDLDRPDDGA